LLSPPGQERKRQEWRKTVQCARASFHQPRSYRTAHRWQNAPTYQCEGICLLRVTNDVVVGCFVTSAKNCSSLEAIVGLVASADEFSLRYVLTSLTNQLSSTARWLRWPRALGPPDVRGPPTRHQWGLARAANASSPRALLALLSATPESGKARLIFGFLAGPWRCVRATDPTAVRPREPPREWPSVHGIYTSRPCQQSETTLVACAIIAQEAPSDDGNGGQQLPAPPGSSHKPTLVFRKLGGRTWSVVLVGCGRTASGPQEWLVSC